MIMKKSTATVLIIILALAGAVGMAGYMKSSKKDASYSFSHHLNLEIREGKADPEKSVMDFGIDKDGEYTISLGWLPMGKTMKDLKDLQPSDYSFITGCVISSADDPCVYATTAGWITLDTSIKMKAGTYTVTYYYLTSREAYADFAAKYFGTESAESMADWFEWDSFKKDDKLVISYSGRVSEAGAGAANAWLLVVMVSLAGLAIVAVFWFISKGAFDKEKYDERQLIERGKASTYALYSVFAYIIVMFLFDGADMLNRDMLTPIYMGALALGVVVSSVYSIWHGCYFALNLNKVRYMIVMVIVGLANLGFVVFDVCLARKFAPAGSAYQTWILRIGICGFEIAAMFIILAAAMFLRHRADVNEQEE